MTAKRTARRRLRPATIVLLLGFFALLTVAIAEIGLRLVGFSHPAWNQVDPVLGLALRPEAEGWHRDEGEVYVRLNSEGLRDREHALAKPEGVLRVAVLGDSFAEALQVERDETFWSVLERELAGSCAPLADAGLSVEVLNFGVSGFGTAQELLMLRSRAWRYDPDLVLLAFLSANDVRNNLRALEGNDLKPYFLLGDDGELELDDSYLQSERYRRRASGAWKALQELSDHSRIVQLANRLKRDTVIRRALASTAEEQREADPGTRALAEIGREALEYRAIYAPPADPVWDEAWRVTEAIIERMHEEVMERRRAFLLVTLSNGIQVHPDAALRRRYAELLGVPDLFYPERRLAALGAAEGFPVLTLAPPLAEAAERDGDFLHGFANSTMGEGHWNARGHALAGRAMAPAVCEVLSAVALP